MNLYPDFDFLACNVKPGSHLCDKKKKHVPFSMCLRLCLFHQCDIWKDLPSSLKDLSVFAFPKHIKRYLLSEKKNRTIFPQKYFKVCKFASHLFTISVIFFLLL